MGLNYDFAIARLNADGTLDKTFDTDGKQTVAFDISGTRNDSGRAVVIDPNGKILVVGSADVAMGELFSFDFAIARLNADGSLDETFDANGGRGRRAIPFDRGGQFFNSDLAYAVAIDGNGKIVMAGSAEIRANDTDFAIIRLNSDGTLDNTFGTDGKKTVFFDLGS